MMFRLKEVLRVERRLASYWRELPRTLMNRHTNSRLWAAMNRYFPDNMLDTC